MTAENLAPKSLLGRPVPRIAVGCAPLGSMPEAFGYRVTQRTALATIETALDSPLNWLDTAWKYGKGESLKRIGAVLRERGGLPARAMIDTKIGQDGNGVWGLETGTRLLDETLHLLGLDHIPLVFLHDPEYGPWEDVMGAGGTMQALRNAKAAGKIGAIGVAGGDLDVLRKCIDTTEFEAVITHNRYTLLNRSAESVIAHCHEIGLPIMNAAPYAGGLLANPARAKERYVYGKAPAHILETLARIESICERWHVPIAAAALQFSLRDERITSTIVGMTGVNRIDQTLFLAQIQIPEMFWQDLMDVPFDANDIDEKSLERFA